MVDREKVLKGLEICKNPHGRCAECPYDDDEIDFTNCTSTLCWDALALLKERENERKRNPVIVCPHCGKRVK